MRKLRSTRLVTYSVKDNDLERFVRAQYGTEYYDFQDDGSKPDQVEFKGINRRPLDDYDQRKVDGFIGSGIGSDITELLLRDLCCKGKIPRGDYVIYRS